MSCYIINLKNEKFNYFWQIKLRLQNLSSLIWHNIVNVMSVQMLCVVYGLISIVLRIFYGGCWFLHLIECL